MLRDVLKEAGKGVEDFILDSMAVKKDNIPELTRRFKNLREVKDFLDDLKKVVDSTYEQYSKQIIPDAFENIKMDSCKLHSRNFIVSARLWASIPENKEEVGFPWLVKNNWEMLIQRKVNAQKLSSAMTGLFRETNTLPPKEAMSITVERHTSIRS
jgi:hypothetical protein